MLKGKRSRICLDLTPNETIDRHGGIGRYGHYLLQHLLPLPEVRSGKIELMALPISSETVISAEEALSRRVLSRPPLEVKQHRRNRKFLSSLRLHQAKVDLFHATQPMALPLAPGCKVVCSVYDLVPIVCPRPFPSRVQTA
ncbi:MAG TPA: hypothetical protein VK524_11350, partial [Polyangiaceae bacterium]|nr:hypothetical protein [Polyangiaceae bacterium]